MAVTVLDPNDTQSQLQNYANTAIQDLNSNNFKGAWDAALQSSGLYNTNGYGAAMGSASQDPLLRAMESSQGLQQLDPSKQWNTAEVGQFYNAFNSEGAYHGQNISANGGTEALGKNPYGNWGNAADIASGKDAAANIAQEGLTPDVQRFAGAKPTTSFMGKYGADIALAVTAIAAPYAVAAMAPYLSAGAAIASAGATGAATGMIGTAAAGALYGAGAGALMGGITGGNIGQDALKGMIGGGIGGVAAGLGQMYNVPGMVSSAAGKYLTGQVDNGLGLNSPSGGGGGRSMGNTNSGQQFEQQFGGQPSGGYAYGGTGVAGTATGAGDTNYGQLFSGLGSIGSAGLGLYGANKQGGMQTNAYTTAGNAANSGNNFGFNGLGGMGGGWNNGMLNMNPGAMGGAANGFSSFANNQTGMANMYGNGGVPSSVTGGFNQFNNQLNNSMMFNGMGQRSASGVMGMGQNMLGSANATAAGAYNTALQAGQQALNPMIQQQSNALLNSNFAKGMSGSSGGALQTQALQNSFNQAELQNQTNAFNTGNSLFNSTINAGMGMFNSGAGQMGNFNNAGAAFGQQGMTGAMNYSAFSPQLAGMYNNNAGSAVQGMGGINNMMLGNFNAGLGAAGNQGNQMNSGARTQMLGANSYNGGAAGYGASVLSNPNFGTGVNNLINGGMSLFQGMTGGGDQGYTTSWLNSQNLANNNPFQNFMGNTQPMDPGSIDMTMPSIPPP
jgi:hypothetical protein